VDLVVHTAGPFQGGAECTVLQAAISTKVTGNMLSLRKKCISVATSVELVFVIS
jgi:hypothetical protein